MIELLGSKAGVSCGRFHYGSAFGEKSGHADKVVDIRYSFIFLKTEVSCSVSKLLLWHLMSSYVLLSFQRNPCETWVFLQWEGPIILRYCRMSSYILKIHSSVCCYIL